jgi:hypothetical protein
LLRNTENWLKKEFGHLSCYYQDTVAEKNIEQWGNAIIEFDKKLNSSKSIDIYVCNDCNDMACMLHLVGINYLMDANGFSWLSTVYTVTDKDFAVYTQRLSNQKADTHDLFHWRTRAAISDDEKYSHYMVCGCAYVYGGSWGYRWKEIREMFKARMKYDRKTDWLKLYFERYNFGESQAEHLLVTQFINALIIQKVEKEQGFPAVMELLSSGSMYDDRENFFRILEKVTGINEKNFNKEVWKLVQGI